MIVIYSRFVVLSLTVALLTYTSRTLFSVKLIALAAVVALGLSLDVHYRDQLGSPILGHPEGEFTYVYHEVKGESIYLWAWTEDKQDRLYAFPYDQETAEKLEEAKQRSQEGNTQEGAFINEPLGDADEHSLEIGDEGFLNPDAFKKG